MSVSNIDSILNRMRFNYQHGNTSLFPSRIIYNTIIKRTLSFASTVTIPPQQSPPTNPWPSTKHAVEFVLHEAGGGDGGMIGPGNGVLDAGVP